MKNSNLFTRLILFSVAFSTYFLPLKLYSQQAGTLDSAFGNNGVIYCETNFVQGSPYSIIDTQNRIVSLYGSNDSTLTLFRHLIDGTLDSIFGNNGLAVHNFGNSISIFSLQIQKDGKILCAGTIQHLPDTITDNQSDFFIARFLPDGNLDSSFANNGQLIIDLGLNEILGGLTLQEDSAILLSGSTNNVGWATGNAQIVLIRLLPDGTPDSTFGVAGITLTDLFPTGPNIEIGGPAAVQPDGKIVLAVNIGSILMGYRSFAIVRYESNGMLDFSFASNGISLDLTSHVPFYSDITLQDNGSVILAGTENSWFYGGFSLALRQYTSQGQLDNFFANNGIYLSAMGSNPRSLWTLKIQSDHKIIAAGQWEDSLLLMRFTPQGQPDATFASQGMAFAQFNGWYSHADHIYLYPNDKITLLGYASNGMDTSQVFIARYHNDISSSIPNEPLTYQFGMQIYPNPATNHLTIALLNNFKEVVVTITDISEKIIYKTTASQTQKLEVNTKDFAEGIYLVQIQTEKFIETKKVIVSK